MPAHSTVTVPPVRAEAPRLELRLLVLAVERDHCVGIDLASGALVRAWTTEPIDPQPAPYDVISGSVDDASDRLPDPTEPEAIVLLGAPVPAGRMVGRKAERRVRRILHPGGRPLLGFHGPAVPFWARSQGQPSVAVIEPEGPGVLLRRGSSVWCRFTWRRLAVQLPCVDPRVSRELSRGGRSWFETAKSDRLVVALTPPIEGHCHKVVVGVLARPGRRLF